MNTPPRQNIDVQVPNAPARYNRNNYYQNNNQNNINLDIIPNVVLNRLAAVYNNNINFMNNNEANVLRVIDNLGRIVHEINNPPAIRRLDFNNIMNDGDNIIR